MGDLLYYGFLSVCAIIVIVVAAMAMLEVVVAVFGAFNNETPDD